MRLTIEGPPGPDEPPRALRHRLAAFAVIWCASLLVVAGVAYALRALLIR